MTSASHRDFHLRQTSAWRSQIEQAQSEAEVLQLCVDFLSLWTAHRLAALPDNCQPPFSMYKASQVADYAVRLVQTELMEESLTPELHAMASYFAATSARLSFLLASAPRSERVPFFVRSLK
jgi:hypothetical protein